MKDEERDEIVSGSQVFYCSSCLFEFPLEIAFKKPLENHADNGQSVQNNTETSGKIAQEDNDDHIEVLAIVHETPDDSNTIFRNELALWQL